MYGGLFTHDEFAHEVNEGFVRVNAHPEADLYILNYTEKAAYDGHWNNVTLNCRGLIVDLQGNIVARPFPKFFNYGQVGCPEVDLDEPAVISDKMDGSLGILYHDLSSGGAIATRGSFTSDQAIHATKILRTKYADFKPVPGFTYLFEIVYPENRIVCDYSGMDDLVFLGVVNIRTGESFDSCDAQYAWRWEGPKAEVFEYQTMREALAAPMRPGKEGFVVHLLDSDVRVKIKQSDYIELHKLVTGLNARSVWQAMVDGTVDELIEQVPDEFHGFVRGVQQNIDLAVRTKWAEVWNEYVRIGKTNPVRKDFAAQACKSPYRAELFVLYDGKDALKYILEKSKPAHDYSPVKVNNDAD